MTNSTEAPATPVTSTLPGTKAPAAQKAPPRKKAPAATSAAKPAAPARNRNRGKAAAVADNGENPRKELQELLEQLRVKLVYLPEVHGAEARRLHSEIVKRVA
jgi:hypothetical protein